MLGKKKKGKGNKGKGNKDKDKDKKKGDKTKDKEKEGKGDMDQDKDKENKGDKDQDKDKENDDKTKGKGKEDECSAVSTKDACESHSDCMWDVGYGFMSPACARKGDSAKESEETGEGESSEEPEKKEEEPTTEMKEAAKDLTSCQQILCSQDPPITDNGASYIKWKLDNEKGDPLVAECLAIVIKETEAQQNDAAAEELGAKVGEEAGSSYGLGALGSAIGANYMAGLAPDEVNADGKAGKMTFADMHTRHTCIR